MNKERFTVATRMSSEALSEHCSVSGSSTDRLSWDLCSSHLDQFHHQEELGGRLHLLNQHDDVWMLHSAQDRHFVLNQMFLGKRV